MDSCAEIRNAPSVGKLNHLAADFGGRSVPQPGKRCSARGAAGVTQRQSGSFEAESIANSIIVMRIYNNNNVHLSCAHQRPERSHDTY